MAVGKPVVASRLSGIPELVQDGRTGSLAPPRDVTALANVLERLCSDPALRQQMGLAGRARILEKFDLHANASLLVQQFNMKSFRD